jgi:hypothetical protein
MDELLLVQGKVAMVGLVFTEVLLKLSTYDLLLVTHSLHELNITCPSVGPRI